MGGDVFVELGMLALSDLAPGSNTPDIEQQHVHAGREIARLDPLAGKKRRAEPVLPPVDRYL
jgi:hypothetical protein